MPMTLISRTTLTTSAASVTFNSIPQTFQTLKLVVSQRTNRGTFVNDAFFVYPNGSSSNMTARRILGSGSSASSDTGAGILSNSDASTASTFSSSEVTIPNYFGSTNKPISADTVTENNGSTAYQSLHANLWSDTRAVTLLTMVPETGTAFLSGSTFSLYGLA